MAREGIRYPNPVGCAVGPGVGDTVEKGVGELEGDVVGPGDDVTVGVEVIVGATKIAGEGEGVTWGNNDGDGAGVGDVTVKLPWALELEETTRVSNCDRHPVIATKAWTATERINKGLIRLSSCCSFPKCISKAQWECCKFLARSVSVWVSFCSELRIRDLRKNYRLVL